MSGFYEHDDPNSDLMMRLERDEEREPRPLFARPPRRKQFRYWSGLMFRPVPGHIDRSAHLQRAS